MSSGMHAAPAGPARDLRTLAAVALLAAVGIASGLSPQVLPLWAAYLATAAIGVGLLAAGLPPLSLAAALVLAGAAGESSLVPDAGRNLPELVLAIPLFGSVFREVARDRSVLVRPPRAVVVGALLYLAASAWSLVPSTLGGLRPTYPLVVVATMAIGLGLGLVVVPSAAVTPRARRGLLIAVAALGPLLVAIEAFLVLFGPVQWLGSWLGAWVMAEVTVLGHPTGLILQRVTGPFERPAGASTILAVSSLAILALRPTLTRGWRIAASAALVVVELALAITMNRDGWLILALAAGLMAAVTLWQGRLDVPSLATGVLFLGLMGAITLNLVGANLRPDAAIAHYGAAVAATIPGTEADTVVQLRGGASLTGRSELWDASVKAIQLRPAFGWGLGSDQAAIGPLLAPEAQRFRGLTSDSTWLLTAVETGLVGLLSLAVLCLAVLAALGRRFIRARQDPLDPLALAMGAVFVGLLAGGTFETYLPGGLTFPSFELALATGLAVGQLDAAAALRLRSLMRRTRFSRLPRSEPAPEKRAAGGGGPDGTARGQGSSSRPADQRRPRWPAAGTAATLGARPAPVVSETDPPRLRRPKGEEDGRGPAGGPGGPGG